MESMIIDILHSSQDHLKTGYFRNKQEPSENGRVAKYVLYNHTGKWLVQPKCHHLSVHCKFTLNIEYCPTYERLVGDYEKAASDNVRKSIEMVNWKAMFANKDVH